MSFLDHHIEALIFCATEPLLFKEIKACLTEILTTEVNDEDIRQSLQRLLQKFETDNYAFQIYEVANGYQFMTKPAYYSAIQILLRQKSKKQLSKSALETLAIIAYRQPVTKGDVENIRGVGSDYAIQKLLDKELIIIKGKADTPGRPMLYATSTKFMEYFGLKSLDELPQPKDFANKEENE